MKATCVYIWVEPVQDGYGDEFPEFLTARCDDDGEPVGEIVKCSSAESARKTAEELSRGRLEIIDDMPVEFR